MLHDGWCKSQPWLHGFVGSYVRQTIEVIEAGVALPPAKWHAPGGDASSPTSLAIKNGELCFVSRVALNHAGKFAKFTPVAVNGC